MYQDLNPNEEQSCSLNVFPNWYLAEVQDLWWEESKKID